MVVISDGLGRPYYVLDTQTGRRFHPYTGEPVAHDYTYPHPDMDMPFGEVILCLVGFVVGISSVVYGITLLTHAIGLLL